MESDPLLKPNPDRFVLFPIRYPELWDSYKKQVACFWSAEEINFSSDQQDWKTLTSPEKKFIKLVLGFFAASDGIVVENLAQNMLTEIQSPEARCFYGFQIMMENMHSETYSLLIDTYIRDPVEKTTLLRAVDNYASVQAKAQWSLDWINNPKSTFAQRLVAFAIVEGVYFSASFCAIYWFKKRNLLHGLTFSNELIARDEGLHTDFACLLYSKLQTKLDQKTVQKMLVEAVDIEHEFVDEALPAGLLGMNADMMKQYVSFVADRLLVSLGYEKVYNTENPFEWMEMISLQGKTNFFAKRVSEYQKAGVMNDEPEEFTLDTDF